MLSQTAYHRFYRFSAWYDLVVTWPFAMPFTLALYWGPVLGGATEALGMPPLPALDAHAVLFANFFGTVVLIWSVVRLQLNDPALALYDGIGRAAFSFWMINALMHGATPLIWAFVVPEIIFAILQLVPPRRKTQTAS